MEIKIFLLRSQAKERDNRETSTILSFMSDFLSLEQMPLKTTKIETKCND